MYRLHRCGKLGIPNGPIVIRLTSPTIELMSGILALVFLSSHTSQSLEHESFHSLPFSRMDMSPCTCLFFQLLSSYCFEYLQWCFMQQLPSLFIFFVRCWHSSLISVWSQIFATPYYWILYHGRKIYGYEFFVTTTMQCICMIAQKFFVQIITCESAKAIYFYYTQSCDTHGEAWKRKKLRRLQSCDVHAHTCET